MTATRWSDPDVVVHYAPDGPANVGEELLWPALLEAARGARVLDVGIGAGRTTARLLPVAGTYTGIDVSEPLLTKARAAYPDADLRTLDARELGTLPREAYDVVLWSLNGIDVLDHDERGHFLDAIASLLRPGGLLVYSTHNLDGPSCREMPWHPTRTLRQRPNPAVRTIRLAIRHARYYAHAPTLVRSLRHYAVTYRRSLDGEGWAWVPLRSHEFRFVCHFARLGSAVAEASDRGFTVERIVTNHGQELAVETERHGDDFAHLVCRRNDLAQNGEQGSAPSA